MVLMTATITIGEWLRNQLNANPSINQTGLGIAINVGQSTISKWLRDISVPDTENCRKLAQYFQVPQELVLRLAGHIVPEINTNLAESRGTYVTNSSPALGEALSLFNALDDDDQERILIYMRALLRSQVTERRRENGTNLQESPAPG